MQAQTAREHRIMTNMGIVCFYINQRKLNKSGVISLKIYQKQLTKPNSRDILVNITHKGEN